MTREERIKLIKYLKYNRSIGADYSITDKDVDEIIKALEQEHCDDCISRQAVLAISEDSCLDLDSYEDTREFCDGIKDLPSVTPRPKMGHWIKYSIPRCGEQHYQCVSCKYYINFGQWGELYTKEFKYCPNCGAKMEEVEE